MGEIYVKGHGRFKVAGDEATPDELKQIKEFIASPEYKGTQVEKNTDEFLQSPSWGRIALEIGGGIAGSVATGGLGLPLLAARVAMLSRPFLMALGKSSAGSFGGGFAGSLASETFDPTDHAFKTAVRAGTVNAIGEGIGAPVGIKAFNALGKVFKPALRAQVALDDAEMRLIAEKSFTPQGRKEILEQYPKTADAIIKHARQNFVKGEKVLDQKIQLIRKEALDNRADAVAKYGDELVVAAEKAEITPGVKYENRVINILENLSEASLFGGGSLVTAKQGTKVVANSLVDDFNQSLIALAGRQKVEPGILQGGDDVGEIFINAMAKREEAFNRLIGTRYGKLGTAYDDLLKITKSDVSVPIDEQALIGAATIKKTNFDLGNVKQIDTTKLRQSLEDYLDTNSAYYANASGAKAKIKENIAFLNKNEKLTFKEMLDFKQGLNDDVFPALTAGNKNAYKRVAADLMKMTKDAIKQDKFLKSSVQGQKLLDDLKITDEIFSEGKGFFNANVIQQIVKKLEVSKDGFLNGPGSQVVNDILNVKHPQLIKDVFKHLKAGKEAGTINQRTIEKFKTGLKSKLFGDILDLSRINKGNLGTQINPNKMEDLLVKHRGAFDELFDAGERKIIRDNVNALKLAYGKIAEAGNLPGGVAITLAQPGALATGAGAVFLGTGNFGLGIATLLVGPYAISKAFTSKGVSNYLRKSFQQYQNEAVESFTKTGEISNFRKTQTSLRQLSEKLLAENIIDRQTYDSFNDTLPSAVSTLQEDIRIQKQAAEDVEKLEKDNKEDANEPVENLVPKRRPTPLDDALDGLVDSMTPQASAPTPQPQAPAPRAQGSGIASLGNQSDQLARMEQVGLPLFRG